MSDERIAQLEADVADLTRRLVGQEWLRGEVEAVRQEVQAVQAALAEIEEVRKLAMSVMKMAKDIRIVIADAKGAADRCERAELRYREEMDWARRGGNSATSETMQKMQQDIRNLRAIAAYRERNG